jgi:phosphatidylinositol kinase/protein kinase (PI-3  family)
MFVKVYEILATGNDCGIMEFINDSMSIDAIKKKLPDGLNNLKDYFLCNFGSEDSKCYKKARNEFCRSLAGYSLVCYILNIKDRHNGNIMIDTEGHIIHIDFGFMLSNAPGKGFTLEKAPFKLTNEYIDILGPRSKTFKKFKQYLRKGFTAIQKHADKVMILVEMMSLGQTDLKCFEEGRDVVLQTLKERIFPSGRIFNKKQCKDFINVLISQAHDNWRTVMYDRIQYCC